MCVFLFVTGLLPSSPRSGIDNSVKSAQVEFLQSITQAIQAVTEAAHSGRGERFDLSEFHRHRHIMMRAENDINIYMTFMISFHLFCVFVSCVFIYPLCIRTYTGRHIPSPRPPLARDQSVTRDVNMTGSTIKAPTKTIALDSPIRQLPKPELEDLMRRKQMEIAALENSITKLMDKSNASLGKNLNTHTEI